MKKIFSVLLALCSMALYAQKSAAPKLVVGIVIDQMRSDYLYRYADRMGKGGFHTLLNQGFYFSHAQYNYVPTYTGPGHASIFTGTTPAVHGIIGNNWYMKESEYTVYCTEDSLVLPVGTNKKAGKMSPRLMLSSTIGDELKLQYKESKVIGIALKDRSSILPAGHSADAAYWFEFKSGTFISSSHYMQQLPEWVQRFNADNLSKKYLQQGWQTLYSIDSYNQSTQDSNPYEYIPKSFGNKVFPYTFQSSLEKEDYEVIKYTPYGNSITKDFAIEAIKSEKLGQRGVSDLLTISFSSTDYAGHAFGPRSIEIEDMYLRLDKDIAEIIATLDKEVGKDNYIIFLTADHGACDVPHLLANNKIPSGYVHEDQLATHIKQYCKQEFGDSLLISYINQQIFLNEKYIEQHKLNKSEIEAKISQYLLAYNGISEAYPSAYLKYHSYHPDFLKYKIQKGYNHKRSGDIAISYLPGWMEYMPAGTTHGSSYNYDTHVPLIFYGKSIAKGRSVSQVNITDIAPTISTLLGIPYPNGNTGHPIKELWENKK